MVARIGSGPERHLLLPAAGRGLRLCLGLLFLLLSCSPPRSDQPASQTQLRLATFNEGSSWYVYGASLAQQIQGALPAGSNIQVLPFAGGIGNPALLARHKADLALLFDVTALWALRGSVAFDEPFPALRVLVGGLDQYYVVAVRRRDWPVKDLARMVERRMPARLYTPLVGSQGELLARLILDAYGVDYRDLEAWGGTVRHTTFDVIKAAFNDERLDLFIHGISVNHPTLTEVATLKEIDFLPLDPGVMAHLRERYGFVETTLPAGSFRGQEAPVPTIGYHTILATTAEFPEGLAHTIVQAVVKGRESLVEVHRGLALFDPASAARVESMGVPLHPGARRYYREAGWLP